MSRLEIGVQAEWPAGHALPANALADRFMHVVLYVTILSSFFVFVQPAPYEYLAVLLGFACVLARVRLNRVVLPLLFLLLVRDIGGALGLLPVLQFGWTRISGPPSPLVEDFGYSDSIRFLATSFYLGLTAVLFACILSQDTMRRIATLRSAYIMSGVVASVLGTMGYFNLYFNFIPGFEVFSLNERAVAGFKDPDVLGCFLIPPLMWLIEGFIVDKVRLHNLVASIIIFVGLLLAFSRAAWGSFVFTTILLVYFLYVTGDNRQRKRILFFILGSLLAAALIFMLLSSIDVVQQMFTQRSRLLEQYDVFGNRSRFALQQDSLREIFDHPLGLGPWGFAHSTNWVSHNSYLGTFLNHGWIGGAAYLTLVTLTLTVGFRILWVRTPWQTFLIATYLPFLALALESLIVDTDHWRHFYLLLGAVWGLVAATQTATWQERVQPQTDLLRPGMQSFRQSLGRLT